MSKSVSQKEVFELPLDQQTQADDARLEESLRDLRYAESASQRADAARNLGMIRSRMATANLVAALFDVDAEVRNAAAQALDEIGDPSVAMAPMRALVGTELEMPLTVPQAEATEGVALDDTQDISGDLISSVDYESQVQPEEIDLQDLISQENAARDAVADLQRQLVGIEVAKASAESEVRLCAEREARLEASVTALIGEEKELRERADEIADRRIETDEQLRLVQSERSQVEHRVGNLIQQADQISHETQQIRLLAEQYVREIARTEAAKVQATFAAQRAEAQRSLQQAEALHKAELERLRQSEEDLQRALEQAALSRIEVDSAQQEAEKLLLQLQEKRAELAVAEAKRREDIERARQEAEVRNQQAREELRKTEEALRDSVEQVELRRAQIDIALQETRESATRLSEVQARIQAAEDARRQDEAEYARLEAEASQQAQEASRRLEAFRIRVQEEQQRLEEEAARRAEEETRRIGELDNFRKNLETEARRRMAKEKAIQDEIKQLLQSEADQRDQIEKAELRLREIAEQHRAAEEEARLKLQQQERAYEVRRKANEQDRLKAEEEIRRRLTEEQHLKHEAEETIRKLRIDARREAEKRAQRSAQLVTLRQQLATEAAGDLAREEHLKNEIEQLQKEEEKLRLRIQSEARLRARIEERIQQEKERLQAEEVARRALEEQMRSVAAGESSLDLLHHLTHIQSVAPDLPLEVMANFTTPDPLQRASAVAKLSGLGPEHAFNLIVEFFDDPSIQVRNAAAEALQGLDPQRSVETFTRAIEEAPPTRRASIGAAMAGSGLAAHAVNGLGSESREQSYNALCFLFTMAKTGEIQPLVEAIERHEDVQVRRAAIRLLNLVGQPEVAKAAAKRRLSLFTES